MWLVSGYWAFIVGFVGGGGLIVVDVLLYIVGVVGIFVVVVVGAVADVVGCWGCSDCRWLVVVVVAVVVEVVVVAVVVGKMAGDPALTHARYFAYIRCVSMH